MDLTTVAAVLLDMDGTLVDSDAVVERTWAEWAVEYGLDPAGVLVGVHGRPAEGTVRAVRPDLDEEGVRRAADRAREIELGYGDLADVVPVRGAAELVTVMTDRGLPWAVVTSADARVATARLAGAGVRPPLLVTREDVDRGKPDPEGYLLAASKLGVDAASCLVVEDSEPGLAAGRAAGMRVAALRGLAGDLRLRDLADLARLLA